MCYLYLSIMFASIRNLFSSTKKQTEENTHIYPKRPIWEYRGCCEEYIKANVDTLVDGQYIQVREDCVDRRVYCVVRVIMDSLDDMPTTTLCRFIKRYRTSEYKTSLLEGEDTLLDYITGGGCVEYTITAIDDPVHNNTEDITEYYIGTPHNIVFNTADGGLHVFRSEDNRPRKGAFNLKKITISQQHIAQIVRILENEDLKSTFAANWQQQQHAS